MTSFAENLIRRYPQPQYVRATTKRDVFTYIESLRDLVASLEDFSVFPEGSPGVVLYALLKWELQARQDCGDLGYVLQGLEMVLRASCEELIDSLRGNVGWPPKPGV